MRQHSKKKFGGSKPSSKLTLKTKWYHSCGCCDDSRSCEHLKKLVTNHPLLYPLKTSEYLRFSDVFRVYRSEKLVENGLNLHVLTEKLISCHYINNQSLTNAQLTRIARVGLIS